MPKESLKTGDICILTNPGMSNIPLNYNNVLCIILFITGNQEFYRIQCFDVHNSEHLKWNAYGKSLVKIEE